MRSASGHLFRISRINVVRRLTSRGRRSRPGMATALLSLNQAAIPQQRAPPDNAMAGRMPGHLRWILRLLGEISGDRLRELRRCRGIEERVGCGGVSEPG